MIRTEELQMATIKIEDLPVLDKLNEKQSKGIYGGFTFNTFDTSKIIDSYSTATYLDPAFEPDGFFLKIESPKF